MPPAAKIYEALTAIADDRVKLTSETSAEVSSSTGNKSYVVEWATDLTWISSNDNASFWQGYVGYPIVAALIKKGRLKVTPDSVNAVRNIHWKELNTKHKNKYQAAIDEVFESGSRNGVERSYVEAECQTILAELAGLKLGRPPRKRAVAKEKKASDQMDLLS